MNSHRSALASAVFALAVFTNVAGAEEDLHVNRTVESYLDEGYRFVTVGCWNDAGISGGVAEALDIARKASGRDNE